MVTAADIKQWIEQNLSESEVMAEGDGQHFSATVICAQFAGQSRMQRHRMVYAALGKRMDSEIHALSLKTCTPTEYQGI